MFFQRAALENMQKILKAAGSGLEHVLKVNVYLANIQRDFAPMNEVYLEVCHGVLHVEQCLADRRCASASFSLRIRLRALASALLPCPWAQMWKLNVLQHCLETLLCSGVKEKTCVWSLSRVVANIDH